MSHKQYIISELWIPNEVKLETDERVENTNYDYIFNNGEDKMQLGDLKPSLKELQASLSSAEQQSCAYNIDSICRLCGNKLKMEEFTRSVNDIFNYNYPTKILKCTSLKVQQDDLLPRKICSECVKNLNCAYYFRSVCIKTSKLLIGSTINDSLVVRPAHTEILSTQEIQPEPQNTDDEDIGKKSKSETHHKMDDSSEFCDVMASFCHQDLWEADVEEMEEKKEEDDAPIFDPISSSNPKKYTKRARKNIAKYAKREIKKDTESETDEKIDDSSKFRDDMANFCHQDLWKDEFEEMAETGEEHETPIFDLTYPSNRKKYINQTKGDIAKYIKQGGREVLCPFCPFTFDVEPYCDLLQHLDSHKHIENNYVCRYDKCNDSFKSQTSRKSHEATDHDTQKLELRIIFCEYCGSIVTSRTYQNPHSCGKKKFQRRYYHCHLCPYKLKSKFLLTRHINGAHYSKTVRCSICKINILHNKLRLHMRNEHEPKATCPYCNKDFSQRNIKGHMRTHTGEKPFSCTDCGLDFTFRVSLKTHRKRYHGDDLFSAGKEVS